MFYEYLFQLFLDAPKERIKQFLSHKTIKLGVNQYSQALKLIKEISSEVFYNLLFEKFQEHLQSAHLSHILQLIKQCDPTGHNPPINGKKRLFS